MKKDKGLIFTMSMVLVVALLMILVAVISCQPQTVVVERRGRDFVVITPPPSPKIHTIERGTVTIGIITYTVHKMFDVDERQICTILRYGNNIALSCRPMTVGEYGMWK